MTFERLYSRYHLQGCLPIAAARISSHIWKPTTAGMRGADLGLYGGFVVLRGGGSTYRVPYFGLKGDYGKLNPLKNIRIGVYIASEIHICNLVPLYCVQTHHIVLYHIKCSADKLHKSFANINQTGNMRMMLVTLAFPGRHASCHFPRCR